MRLASFNVLHGGTLDGSHAPLDDLVAACLSLEADVLCLQEIDRDQPRSGGVDQTRVTAEAMGAVAWRFQPALIGEPGGSWRVAADDDDVAVTDSGPAAAAYGVGLISRWPVTRWRVTRLAAARVRSPVFVPGRKAVILLADEPRVSLSAEIQTPAGRLIVATTHLSFVPGWNVVQLRQVTRALAGEGGPCVLLGDLNLPGPVPPLVSGWRSLGRVATFPADRPSVQIDHALGHGAVPEVTAVEARRLPISDHRALLVDLSGPQSEVPGPSGPQSGVPGPSGPQSGVPGPSGPQSGV
ncbi:MAG: endonuclease/exonuclease/phosphatase family protein [Actinomycetota bacterium]|nr:endonuclease/exonuclease/phosphatase family protein [Actinomycetota bacterium]